MVRAFRSRRIQFQPTYASAVSEATLVWPDPVRPERPIPVSGAYRPTTGTRSSPASSCQVSFRTAGSSGGNLARTMPCARHLTSGFPRRYVPQVHQLTVTTASAIVATVN